MYILCIFPQHINVLSSRLSHDVKCDLKDCDYMFEDLSTLAKHKKEVHMVGCKLQHKCEACEEVCIVGSFCNGVTQFSNGLD